MFVYCSRYIALIRTVRSSSKLMAPFPFVSTSKNASWSAKGRRTAVKVEARRIKEALLEIMGKRQVAVAVDLLLTTIDSVTVTTFDQSQALTSSRRVNFFGDRSPP